MFRQLVPSLAILAAVPAWGQAAESTPPPVEDQSADDDAITVSATRLSEDPFTQPYAFYRHEREELDQAVGRTALDRINYGPGVFIQHTAPAQASPFIRGLTGEQTLLMIDGVRLSHATMRPGPNQYAAMVPDMSIQSIDAILGSSSVVNGSDGLTGALDFRLAEAGRGVDTGASPWGTARVDHANGAQLNLGVDGAIGDWRYSVEASTYQFHDRVGGKDHESRVFGENTENFEEIPNTAYEQYAFAGRLAWLGHERHRVEVSLGHTRQVDAPRPDGHFENTGREDRRFREFDPQAFTYLHLRHRWTIEQSWIDSLQSTLWWHRHTEDQRRGSVRNVGDPDERLRRREIDDIIDSIGLDLQAETLAQAGGLHEITWGLTAITERTDNEFREFRTPAGNTNTDDMVPFEEDNWPNETTVPDGSQYDSIGLFAQDHWTINEEFRLLTGLRYSHYAWDFDEVDGDTSDLTGSVRGSWQFRDDMLAFAGVSKAFRAPNLQNLAGAVDRGSSGTPAIGNPDLDAEVSWTVEGGWRYRQEEDVLAVSVFYTQVDDLIQRVFPAGGGPGEFTNAEQADLMGFETEWDYGLPVLEQHGRFAVVGSASLVDATVDVPQSDGSVEEDNISRANRFYGVFGVRYDHERHWWGRFQVRWHDAYDEDDIAAGDAGDPRLTVAGSERGTLPGFAVFDLSAGWQSEHEERWVTLHLENLLNKTYREVGSGTDAPGFNVALAGGIRF